MASPSASSATLSIHSGPCHIDENEDSCGLCTGVNEYVAPIVAPHPQFYDKIQGVLYYGENDFILGDEYFSPAPKNRLSAPMRAASQPDERVLQMVLRDANDMYKDRLSDDNEQRLYGNGIPMTLAPSQAIRHPLEDMSSEFGPNSLRVNIEIGITTPLLEAIQYNLPENVKTLLVAGANPNGVPLSVMESYASFFMRFRPQVPLQDGEMGDLASRREFLDLMDIPQISKLTLEEVEDRYVDGMAPFWCEEGFTPKEFYLNGNSIPSLVAAASSGSTAIFDQLRQAGADDSFWLEPQDHVPDEPTESSLSLSSPLHAAIEIGNLTMVQYLLSQNFNPNILPLASPTRCYTPLMSLVLGHHFSKAIFDALISHPSTRPEIRTPVYQVHMLHFAVARLDPEVLRHVSSNPKISLHSARTTALGHTLLHVACMPANALHVQRRAEVVYRSIHETRNLSADNDPHTQYPPEFDGPISSFETHFQAQTEIVKYLWQSGIRDFEKQDVHGNTALHYLAGCQSMNWGLLEWLNRVDEDVKTIWREVRNELGATAEEMAYVAGKCRAQKKSGWCDWFERHNSRWRMDRKEIIWEGLLGLEGA